jgi:membrane protein DedA with SNARE-associated domain/membrane-associated phospholipid phosphatase
MSAGQIAATVVAVLIAAGVAWRWRRLGLERRVGALLVVLVLGVYASGVLSALPDALGAWTYALVGALAFLETGAFVGLVAPGETVVIAGGVIAGQGEIELVPLIGLVWICAILGDTTSFYIGRRLGRGFLERHGPRVKITHERLEQVERYFELHGGKTILIGRFIGLVRALAPFIAGSSGLLYARFIPFSVLGTGLWATTFCVLGYVFWRSFDQVAHVAGQATLGFGLTAGLIVAILVAYRRRRQIRAWLLCHQRHPLLRPGFAVGRPLHRRFVRPVARVLGPQLRFLWNRLTPGMLGLELTTALALGVTGIYVYVLYVVVLTGGTGITPLDHELLDLGNKTRANFAVDVAKLISDLGSFATVATAVGLTAVLLAARRRPAELLVLLLGFAMIYLAVHVTKAAIDRPRPAGPLVGTTESAFPSGHAAYVTAWIALAVVYTRRLGLVSRATLVVGAIAIAAAVGLSRIYLRAHYWSDVAGGWGIGVGVFGLLATVALIVEHIRHNGAGRGAIQPAPVER